MYYARISSNGIKAMVIKLLGPSHNPRQLKPNYTDIHFASLLPPHCFFFFKASFTLKCPSWSSKKYWFIQLKSLNTIFKKCCDKMGSMFKALMFHTEVWRHKERNPRDCLNYELNQMLFIWTPFLLGRITNKPWLFRSGYLVGALLGNKQNEATSRKTTNSILLLIIKCKLSGQN